MFFTSQKYSGPISYMCSCTTSEYEKNCNTCIGQYLCGIYIDRELLFILTQTYNRSVNCQKTILTAFDVKTGLAYNTSIHVPR